MLLSGLCFQSSSPAYASENPASLPSLPSIASFCNPSPPSFPTQPNPTQTPPSHPTPLAHCLTQSRIKIPSSPTRAINSTRLSQTLHAPLAPAVSAPTFGTSTSSSTYFPYAVHVCPSHRPVPKCTPEKYVVALARGGSEGESAMCCVVRACWDVMACRLQSS